MKYCLELMGGAIWLKSAPGEGTIFNFSLPLHEGITQPLQEGTKESDGDILKGKTVLVAEYDHHNVELIQKILSREEISVEWAQDGMEAIDFVRNRSASERLVILMDIKMPVIEGHQALKQIKNIDPKIPVIALTAYAQPGDEEKMKKEDLMTIFPSPLMPTL